MNFIREHIIWIIPFYNFIFIILCMLGYALLKQIAYLLPKRIRKKFE